LAAAAIIFEPRRGAVKKSDATLPRAAAPAAAGDNAKPPRSGRAGISALIWREAAESGPAASASGWMPLQQMPPAAILEPNKSSS
jgi:hypothetical protein